MRLAWNELRIMAAIILIGWAIDLIPDDPRAVGVRALLMNTLMVFET